jgi:lysophospholipase L1-like esterase
MKNVFSVLLTVFILAGLVSCNEKQTQVIQPEQEEESMPPMKFLALGDSYTIGESVEIDERWPVQLADSLKSYDIEVANPKIIAVTGWTTGDLAQGIEYAAITDTFNLVSLLIGVNNQYQGRSPTEFRVQFRELLQTAIKYANGVASNVIVVSIPDYGVTPFAANSDQEKIAREIDTFNSLKLIETNLLGARYVDITGISRNAAEDLTLIAEDGLHPSGKMYSQWVELILPEAREILTKDQ